MTGSCFPSFPTRYKEKLFHCKDSEAAEQAAPKSCVVSFHPGRFFKTQLDKLLSNLVWIQGWPCFEQGLGLETFWPFPPSYSMILPTSHFIMLGVMVALHSSLHFSHHPKLAATRLTPNLNRQMLLQALGSLQYFNFLKNETLKSWP